MIFKFRNLETGQARPIPPGQYSLGRDDHNDVQIEDLSVSRFHAVLFNQDDKLFIEDNGSANGTSKSNEYIQGRVQLKLGEIIYIGSVPFRVDPELLDDAGEPVAKAGQLKPVDKTLIHKDTERLPVGPRGVIAPDAPKQEEPTVIRRSTAAVPLASRETTPLGQRPLSSPRPNPEVRIPQELYHAVEIPPTAPFPSGMVALAFMTGMVVGIILGVLMAKQILEISGQH